MLFSVEQVFVGRDETRAPLKTPAWEAKFMTADDSIKCQCAHSGMKSGRFQNSRVCLQAFPSSLPHPPPTHSFTRTIFHTVFDSCSQFLAPKPHGNACYAGSSLNHIFTQKFLKFSHQPHGVRQMQTVDWQVNGVNIVVEFSNRFPIPKLDF